MTVGTLSAGEDCWDGKRPAVVWEVGQWVCTAGQLKELQ